jgi:hypothetical protein
MLYREIIAVCSQIHTKRINKLCGQNVECLNVKPGGVYVCIHTQTHTYSNHLFFEGLNHFNLHFAPVHKPFSKLYHITSHHTTSHHITSHHTTSHHITSHHITLHTTAVYHTHCMWHCSHVLYDPHNKQQLFLQNKIKRSFFIVLTQRVRCNVIITTSQRTRCVRNYNSSLYTCQYLWLKWK